jgi:hypothetical protein
MTNSTDNLPSDLPGFRRTRNGYFRIAQQFGGGVESRHAGYSENEGPCIAERMKLADTERPVAPVAPSCVQNDSRSSDRPANSIKLGVNQ